MDAVHTAANHIESEEDAEAAVLAVLLLRVDLRHAFNAVYETKAWKKGIHPDFVGSRILDVIETCLRKPDCDSKQVACSSTQSEMS